MLLPPPNIQLGRPSTWFCKFVHRLSTEQQDFQNSHFHKQSLCHTMSQYCHNMSQYVRISHNGQSKPSRMPSARNAVLEKLSATSEASKSSQHKKIWKSVGRPIPKPYRRDSKSITYHYMHIDCHTTHGGSTSNCCRIPALTCIGLER